MTSSRKSEDDDIANVQSAHVIIKVDIRRRKIGKNYREEENSKRRERIAIQIVAYTDRCNFIFFSNALKIR